MLDGCVRVAAVTATGVMLRAVVVRRQVCRQRSLLWPHSIWWRAKVVLRENRLGGRGLRQSGMVSAGARAEVNVTARSRDGPRAGANGTSTVG